MPLQQFSTYDVIVDIVPGGVFLLLVYAVLPTEWNSFISGNILLAGIFLLLGGYFAGRMIHGLSAYVIEATLDLDSSEVVDILRESVAVIKGPTLAMTLITKILLGLFVMRFSEVEERGEEKSNQKPTENQEDKGQSRPSSFDHQVDEWFSENRNNVPQSVDWVVVQSVNQNLVGKLRKEPNDVASSSQPDSVAVRRYGENLLYGKNTLYNKYQMLVTFFRNTMMIALPFGLLYLVIGIVSNFWSSLDQSLEVNLSLLLPSSLYILIGISLIAIFIISAYQRRKFLTRMHRAYIYDLHQILNE